MMSGGNFPPLLPPDPGEASTSKIHGSHAGATLPAYLDKEGNHGELVVLKLEPVAGDLPENPFILRKSIERHINGKIDGAFPEARGKTYALKVRNKAQIGKLLQMDSLIDGTAIKISKHTGLNSVRCVINCRGLERMSDEECLEYLQEQKVTYVRRITKKVGDKRENTGTVILTIDGLSRPEHIDVGYQRCKTRPYYPSPMICYRCYSFGHTKARCQQQAETCGHCGQQHPIIQGERCLNPQHCSRCKTNDHSTSSRQCPVYKAEDAVQHIRVDRGISYPAARRAFQAANSKESFAGVATASKDKIIDSLSTQLAKMSENYKAIVATCQRQNTEIEELKRRTSNSQQASNGKEMAELRQLIMDLRADVQKKDERIKSLEGARNIGDQFELIKKHGTIEDLIGKKTLEEENQRLRQSLAKPTEEIPPVSSRTRKLKNKKLAETVISSSETAQAHPNQKTAISNKSSTETEIKRTKTGSPTPTQVDISDEEMYDNNTDQQIEAYLPNFSLSSMEGERDPPDPLMDL